MKQISKKAATLLCVMVLLTIPVGMVFANANNASVTKDQTVEKDWFVLDQAISNEGTVKGDLISFSHTLGSTGKIEGDLIAGATEISMTGKVNGDARVAGATVSLPGEIGKNVNAFASNLRLEDTTRIGGNLLAFANSMEVGGVINGYTRLYGSRIVLKGNFVGDVDINVGNVFENENVELHVLPGTKIQGKLTYKGVNEAFIDDRAQVSSFEWIPVERKVAETKSKGPGDYAIKYLRELTAAAIYFLFALLIYRLFPGLFIYQGDIMKQKPGKVLGVGLAAFALMFAAIITFVFLLAVTALIASPMVAVVFGTVMLLTYTLVFYFSMIPVGMWLGNVLLNGKNTIPTRFGIGFLTITAVQVLLKLLADVSPVGIIFSTLRYITIFGIGVFGVGALLCGLGTAIFRLRQMDIIE